jgi:YgiT-type zinc finger domain-containing protein
MRRCPFCKGEAFLRGSVDHGLDVGARSYETRLPADLCSGCGEGIVAGGDLRAFEHEVARHIASGGPGGQHEFSHLRRFLDLPAHEFADMLDVDTSTVSRWENGAPFDRATWNTLCDLVIDKIEERTTTHDRLVGPPAGEWNPPVPRGS